MIVSKGRECNLSEVGQLQFCKFCSCLIGTLHALLVQNFSFCYSCREQEQDLNSTGSNKAKLLRNEHQALSLPHLSRSSSIHDVQLLTNPETNLLLQLSNSFCFRASGGLFKDYSLQSSSVDCLIVL